MSTKHFKMMLDMHVMHGKMSLIHIIRDEMDVSGLQHNILVNMKLD